MPLFKKFLEHLNSRFDINDVFYPGVGKDTSASEVFGETKVHGSTADNNLVGGTKKMVKLRFGRGRSFPLKDDRFDLTIIRGLPEEIIPSRNEIARVTRKGGIIAVFTQRYIPERKLVMLEAFRKTGYSQVDVPDEFKEHAVVLVNSKEPISELSEDTYIRRCASCRNRDYADAHYCDLCGAKMLPLTKM